MKTAQVSLKTSHKTGESQQSARVDLPAKVEVDVRVGEDTRKITVSIDEDGDVTVNQ